MPDTFFRNEKDGKFHDIIQPNLYVRVFPDGDILYSIRWVWARIMLTLYESLIESWAWDKDSDWILMHLR